MFFAANIVVEKEVAAITIALLVFTGFW